MVMFLSISACSGENGSSKKQAVASDSQKVASIGSPASRASDGGQPKIFRTVAFPEAQDLIEKRKDLVLVDLREPNELKYGYIAGSQLIPMSALSRGTKSLPADKPLLLICAVGGRSYAVGRYYAAKGYPEIYNLKGGVSAWKQAGLPLQY